jgi:hypothetical protein
MATIPTTRTWVAGNVVTAAQMNSDVRDLGNLVLSGKPLTVMYNSAAFTLTASGTTYQMTYDTETIDRDGNHSTSVNTDRWTCQTAGYYMFTHSTLPFAAQTTAAGTRDCWWQFTPFGGSSANTGYYNSVVAVNAQAMYLTPPTAVLYCAVGDYVQLNVRQSSGGSLNITSTTTTRPQMSVYWLSQ